MVDENLEKFFSRVNHDILVERLRKRIDNACVVWMIPANFNSVIMNGMAVVERYRGSPPGNPRSPLFANVMFDEEGKEVQLRDHCFARYGDTN